MTGIASSSFGPINLSHLLARISDIKAPLSYVSFLRPELLKRPSGTSGAPSGGRVANLSGLVTVYAGTIFLLRRRP